MALANDFFTLDWQEYELEENRVKLKELRKELKRKSTAGCEEHGHIAFCRMVKCEFAGFPKKIKYHMIDGLALAKATRRLPFEIRKLIAYFFNQWYYYTPRVPAALINQIQYKYSIQLSEFLVMNALNVNTINLMRGYCPSCGEPVVNSSYFYWAQSRKKPLKTNKYGLTVMRACQTCVYSNIHMDTEGHKIWPKTIVSSMKSITSYPFVLC